MRARSFRLLMIALVATACAPPVDAVVSGGAVTLAAPDADVVVVSGPISFVRRTRATAGSDGADVRVDTDGAISAASAANDVPGAPLGAGIVHFELDAGALIARRDDIAFDLLAGRARVRTGAIAGRLIVMNGRCHLSASADDNREGIDVLLTARDNEMSVEVTRGHVLLNATDEEERDTIFVTLDAGDVAVARMGEAPRKGATEWGESD